MNAVIYARYSSHGQRDVSIEDQVREIESYAKYHNFNIVHVYADRKTTGRNTDKRKEFLKMVSDAEKRGFQCVLVYKYDRFARNKYDAVIYKKKLKDNGVKVVAVAEPIPDGYGAKILEAIYDAMAEEYSENLSQNIKRGQKGNALKCIANHKPTFGFTINPETRKYEIEPKDAAIVRNIFNMVLEGKQMKEVLQYLKECGMPRSQNWLYKSLHNERYTGVYIYGETRIDGGMPQIISKENFEKVQSVMKLRQRKPQLKPYHYLFSGIIYCGYCHSMMCGESATSHTGVIYRYYTCPAYKHKKKCRKKRISADFLEEKAVEALKRTIFSEKIIDRLSNDLFNYLNASKKEYLSDLQKRLSDAEKKLANIQANVERSPNVPASLLDRMCDLEKEKSELLEKINSEQFALDSSEIKKDDLKEFIRNFNQSDDKSIVNTFVTRIVVFDDYAILEYDASGDNEVRIDFCTTSTLVEQDVNVYKILIKDAHLYVRFPLVA